MASLVGKNIKDRYHVNEFVGRGGMAEVYKVWDTQRMTYLAMKVLHQDLALDRVFLRRFEREAKTLQKLQHPNIVRYYDLDQEGTRAFILLDFISGWSLKNLIFSSGGPVPYSQIRVVLEAICGALQFAHSEGFVHSDIKPANVMIDKQGNVLLADFGIARMSDAATATMVGAGTPAYMAPEQIRGENPAPTTDIYSLGIVLYEMLTGGERPFTGEHATISGTVTELVRWEQLNMAPESPKKWNPDIPDTVEQVVMTCLEKDPSLRYSSAVELLHTFDKALIDAQISFAGGWEQPITEIIPTEEFPEVESSLSSTGDSAVLDRPVDKGRKIPMWIFAVVGVLVIAIVAWSVLGSSNPGINASTSQPIGTENGDGDGDGEPTSRIPTATEEPVVIIPSPTITFTLLPTFTPTFAVPSEILSINPKDGMEIVFVEEGEFTMGVDPEGKSPEEHDNFSGPEYPEKIINVDSFWIYRTEVTNAMYQMCVDANFCDLPQNNGSYLSDNYFGNPKYDDYPVVNVEWRQAATYCDWAGGRLPTEAQWEKAARGPNGNKFPWGNNDPGNDQTNLCDSRCTFFTNPNLKEESINDGHDGPAPVGSFPNGMSYYFVYDLSGNVWEWVFDWFQVSYSNLPLDNPVGPASGWRGRRVIRGGSFINTIEDVRALTRESWEIDNATDAIGFRCALQVDPNQP